MARAQRDGLDGRSAARAGVVDGVHDAQAVHELSQRVALCRRRRHCVLTRRLSLPGTLAVEEEDGEVLLAVVHALGKHHVREELGRVMRQRLREALAQRAALVDVELGEQHQRRQSVVDLPLCRCGRTRGRRRLVRHEDPIAPRDPSAWRLELLVGASKWCHVGEDTMSRECRENVA